MKYAKEKDVVGLLKKLKKELILQMPTGSGGGGGSGSGDMLKSIYDQNNNGTVDNAEKLNGKTEGQLDVDKVDGHHASDFALVNHTHPGMGDMLKSIYDQDGDGVVDNSELIEGRKIYVMNRPPQQNEGNDGDIWIEYKE
jgi:hypothetical protein